MKLQDLAKPIDQMSDDELLERLRVIKHNRFVERPAVKAREEKAEKKERKTVMKKASNKIDKMLEGMSEEQRLNLIKLLGGNPDGIQNEGSQA